jgi:CHAD domain-containing protein
MTAHATTAHPAGLGAVLASQSAALASALPRARHGTPRAVHRARTASRRLREALPVAAAAAPGAGALRARRDVRRITRALGLLRDLDVALATVDAEASRFDWNPAAVTRVARDLEHTRERRRRDMLDRLDDIDVDRLLERCDALSAELADHAELRVWERALAGRIRRRAGRLADAIERAGTLYAPEPLHAVRIAAKKLRYSLELAGEAAGLPVQSLIAGCKRAQDTLGRLHDLQVLEQRIRSLALTPADRALSRSLTEMADMLERECRATHATFLPEAGGLVELARQAVREVAPALTGRKLPMMKLDDPTARSRRTHRAR